MKITILVIAGLSAFLSLPVNSEIFQWKDTDGHIQYGDRPPPAAKAKRVEVKINSYESVTIEPFVPFKGKGYRHGNSVVMYSTSWCGFCRKARNYMAKNRIPFEDYDIEKSETGKREYKKLNGRGVPILLIGDKRMNGFNVGEFRSLYDR
jgi:glutaredoxin